MMLRGSVEKNVPVINPSRKEHCTPVTNFRQTPATGRIAKIITMLTTKGRNPDISFHGILVLESARTTQCSQALDETTLYLYREEIEQDQLY